MNAAWSVFQDIDLLHLYFYTVFPLHPFSEVRQRLRSKLVLKRKQYPVREAWEEKEKLTHLP